MSVAKSTLREAAAARKLGTSMRQVKSVARVKTKAVPIDSFMAWRSFYFMALRRAERSRPAGRTLRFVNPTPTGHGALNRDLDQRHWVHTCRIAAQHDQVPQFPRRDAAFSV